MFPNRKEGCLQQEHHTFCCWLKCPFHGVVGGSKLALILGEGRWKWVGQEQCENSGQSSSRRRNIRKEEIHPEILRACVCVCSFREENYFVWFKRSKKGNHAFYLVFERKEGRGKVHHACLNSIWEKRRGCGEGEYACMTNDQLWTISRLALISCIVVIGIGLLVSISSFFLLSVMKQKNSKKRTHTNMIWWSTTIQSIVNRCERCCV